MMMPNAGMNTVVAEWLQTQTKNRDLSTKITDVSTDYVILAIQGPRSRDTLQKLTNVDLNTVKFFGCRYIELAGKQCIISHTGYTGELGFELNITPAEDAEHIFQEIINAGKSYDIKPIGLGARDTLRMEKGFMLAGNEFAERRTPLEATLAWTINWDHDFIGKQALLKQKEAGDYQRLTCLVCQDKGIPRTGSHIQYQGQTVGNVTSGTLSPCLNTGIALGYVNQNHREKDTILDIMIRNKPVKARVIKPPFVPKDWIHQQK
jgi:aminomethyltransferase